MLFRSRYILQTTPAANTLTCKNGKTLPPGKDIRISSTTQGEVQYLYAVSCDFAGNHSAELSRSFTYDSIVPNTPRTSEYRQFFNTDFTITLSLDTPDVVAPERIKYTTDGSILASCTDGALYSSPININATMIIRAIACDQAGNISGEFSHSYTKDTTPPDPPLITGDVGKAYYNQEFHVQLTTAGTAEQIRYIRQASPAPNTLSCENGTIAASGANIEIPRGAAQGAVLYYYFASCDLAGNKSTEISRTFTFDDIVQIGRAHV